MLDKIPALLPGLELPVIRGAAMLAAAMAEGRSVAEIAATLGGPFADDAAMIAASFDTAVLAFLSGRSEVGLALQADLVAQARIFRVAPGAAAIRATRPLRLLGFVAAGDLQTNMPIEFITAHLPVLLDIVFVTADGGLPLVLPEHDVAICLVSDSRPDILHRLAATLAGWPRPVLNDPARVLGGHLEKLSRDGISQLFAGSHTVLAPPSRTYARAVLCDAALEHDWPILARPAESHAGRLLSKLDTSAELAAYLDSVAAEQITLTRFVDYSDADGQYRKRRIVLIEGEPHLAHMAISANWMIHYVNAGMVDSAAKRAEEAAAMDGFEDGFARRHAAAFDEIAAALGLDYVLIDCAEAPDGRLLLFEVEMAAIIHALDPVALFAYKQPHMQCVFEAFGRMLEQAAGVLVE
ncbi:MAG: hypothetical protein P4L66_15540 [Acetobacteraceae bacterium]|nr:hypothetical protein [Acetobacteraceae bacterium]